MAEGSGLLLEVGFLRVEAGRSDFEAGENSKLPIKRERNQLHIPNRTSVGGLLEAVTPLQIENAD